METKNHQFGSLTEALIYPALLVGVMWLVYWAEHLFAFDFYKLGVLPRTLEGLKGVLFMPLLHARGDVNHVLNNSFPTYVLLAAIIYFYREVALKVFVFLWIGTGLLLWVYAENKGAYHIGMSGVIYDMLGFVFTSGVLRRYLPLQAISLFVVFVYGNMIWGIFPIKVHVSWEGHFMGLLVGLLLAFVYRKKSVQRPKYQYEIERDLGIEPPDLEGMWLERQRQQRAWEEEQQRRAQGYFIVYHYVPDEQQNLKPTDENAAQ